jgi:hypothetical protein
MAIKGVCSLGSLQGKLIGALVRISGAPIVLACLSLSPCLCSSGTNGLAGIAAGPMVSGMIIRWSETVQNWNDGVVTVQD